MKRDSMERTELHVYLRSLVDEAKAYPAGDPHRQRALTKAIRVLSTVLWRERSPHYNDALQQTFEYFCRNLDRYDPERATVIVWLNDHLRWRLFDLSLPTPEIPFSVFVTDDHDSPFADTPDLIDHSQSDMLEKVRQWAETDATGELKSVHMKKYPQVTAQFLILQRLPPETSWKKLSQTLEIKIPALAAFYQRHCITRLRSFGKAEGYLL